MEKAHIDVDDLASQKAKLEQRIQGYQASLTTVTGPCSKSSVRLQLVECEMALERIREQLGEI
jgi:hypothetical protein